MTEEQQFAAVAWGDKPICVIKENKDTNVAHFPINTTVKYKLVDGKRGSYNYPEYVYYKDGLEKEAKRVAELIVKDKTDDEHKELGLLLGYSQYEVDTWVKYKGLKRFGAHSGLNNGSGNTTAPMPSPDLGEGKEK